VASIDVPSAAAIPRVHGAAKPGELAVGVVIGRTSEFFEFFVYAIASVLVFPRLVFPFVSPLTGTLYSFAIFALGFLVRPAGTIAFLRLERLYGRGIKLSVVLMLMGSSTVALGFLPAYRQAGSIAIAALIVLRIAQGFALGGSWDGLASLLAINAPEKRRGWYAMLPQLGAPLGLIVASSLFAFFVLALSAEDFLSWGWRYPFFVAFAINVVALFARLRIVVAPEYEHLFKLGELQPSPVPETLRVESRHIVIGTFAPLASFALFHTVTVFPLSWVYLFTPQNPARFLLIETAGAVVGTLSILMSGVLADRLGRRALLTITAGAIAAFSGFAPQMLAGGEIGAGVFMFLGFVLLGLSFGQSSGSVAAGFETRYRYTASALTSDLAWLFGAGFAPWVALALSARFGLVAAGAYLLSGAICTLIALAVYRQLEAQDN
jgi:MFS family permease